MFGSCILLLAVYTQNLLKDHLKDNLDEGFRINEFSHHVDNLVQPVNALQSSIHEFLLGLEPKDTIKDNIRQLQSRLEPVTDHAKLIQNSFITTKVDRLVNLAHRLNRQITDLLKMTGEQRFSFQTNLSDRLITQNKSFVTHIDIINRLDLSPELGPAYQQTRETIQQLQVSWIESQTHISSLLSNRSRFQHNLETDERRRASSKKINARLSLLHTRLKSISHSNSHQTELVKSIQALALSLQNRLNILDELEKGIAVNSWEKDKHTMDSTIRPTFELLLGEIIQLEFLNRELSNHHMERTPYASEQLSSFLWLLAFIFVAIIVATYLIFEYWIRIPIETVAKAMHSEASQTTPQPLEFTGAIEIDYLIDAFELMRTQIQLRQERISLILQNAGEGIILINDKHVIDTINPAAEKMFGMEQYQIIDKNFLTLFDHSNEQLIDDIIDSLTDTNKKETKYLCTAKRMDASAFPVDLTISHMKIEDQVYNILVMRDATKRISNETALNQARLDAEAMQELLVEQVKQLDASLNELRQTQKQLVESEKMASLAGLVAGVAHEINTPIGIGVTASSHLESELKSLQEKFSRATLTPEHLEGYLEDARTATKIIQNNLQRAATLVRGFKQVAVDQSSREKRLFNLHEYLYEIILNLQPRLKKTHHQISVDIPHDISLNSIPGAFSQIFTNLIINSLEHAFKKEQTGHINISAHQQNQIIELIYQDDGTGMSREISEKIFEPFFTTSRSTGGTGLGMHITYNLVTSTLKGTIECSSTIDRGTRFTISIPECCEEICEAML